jgi:hypothetical protein
MDPLDELTTMKNAPKEVVASGAVIFAQQLRP